MIKSFGKLGQILLSATETALPNFCLVHIKGQSLLYNTNSVKLCSIDMTSNAIFKMYVVLPSWGFVLSRVPKFFAGTIAFYAVLNEYPSLDQTIDETIKFDVVKLNKGNG